MDKFDLSKNFPHMKCFSVIKNSVLWDIIMILPQS